MIERQRQRHHRAHHQHQRDDAADGEGQRQQVQPEEAALLALVVDHVQGLDHRLDAGIGAPDARAPRPNRKVAPSAVSPLASTRAIWSCTIWNEPCGQHQCQRLQIGADGGGIGEQSVGRHQRRDGRKYREQPEEHDAGGGREQAVVVDLLIGAPQDVLPAGPGNLEGVAGKPAASVLGEFAARRMSGAAIGWLVSRLRCGDGLKIALRGQDENRRGRDQQQIVGSLGAPAGHQARRSSRVLPPPCRRPAQQRCRHQQAGLHLPAVHVWARIWSSAVHGWCRSQA